nr:MAG TPA: hypothetical protein [Caudoviricetes sp.]
MFFCNGLFSLFFIEKNEMRMLTTLVRIAAITSLLSSKSLNDIKSHPLFHYITLE